MADARHLVARFVGSLSPAPPPPDDEAWARAHLTPGERELWDRLDNPDRRHAVAVARRVVARLGPQAGRPVVAAVGGRTQVAAWSERPGWRGRVGRYVRHDELGAAMLEAAGSDPLTVAWARQHHAPPSAWTVPAPQAAALKAADDD